MAALIALVILIIAVGAVVMAVCGMMDPKIDPLPAVGMAALSFGLSTGFAAGIQ